LTQQTVDDQSAIGARNALHRRRISGKAKPWAKIQAVDAFDNGTQAGM
jgi:hypothetical protein